MTYHSSFKRFGAVAIATMAVGLGAASAQERISIGTASTGSNPYVIGSAIAGELKQTEGNLAVSVQTTAGYNENLGLVSQNEIDMGMAFLFDGVNAYLGEDRFADLPDKEVFHDLRLVFPISVSTYHYVALQKSGIETLDDVRGKRFNINPPSTSSRSIHEALIRALGTSDSDYQIMELSAKDSYDALRNGIVDVIAEPSAVGGGNMLELATSISVNQIEIPDDVFDKLNEEYKDTLARVTIPANTYPNQPNAFKVFGGTASLFANEAVSEEKIYQFTKAYWEHWDDLCKKATAFCGVTIEMAAKPRKLPFHPGAERYFRERGLITD